MGEQVPGGLGLDGDTASEYFQSTDKTETAETITKKIYNIIYLNKDNDRIILRLDNSEKGAEYNFSKYNFELVNNSKNE